MADKILISYVNLSKNKVDAGDKVFVTVRAKSIIPEPINQRLAFRLKSGKIKT